MRWIATLGLLLGVVPLSAQEPRGVEAGVTGMTLLGRRPLWGGGGSLGWRTGGGMRLQLAAVAGTQAGGLVGRGELVGHLLLSPARVRGIGAYGVGGVAGTVGRGDRADLVLGLGLETAPAGHWGVVLEVGVGGGARVAVAIRRRWLHPARSGLP